MKKYFKIQEIKQTESKSDIREIINEGMINQEKPMTTNMRTVTGHKRLPHIVQCTNTLRN